MLDDGMMDKVTILDVETTVDFENGNNNTPFANNSLVSVALCHGGNTTYMRFADASKSEVIAYVDTIDRILMDTYLLVGHNLQFDLMWLRETGFTYHGKLWDTAIFEYIKHLGTNVIMPSLKDCCAAYGITGKSLNLGDYYSKGINTDKIDPETLRIYNIQDIKMTAELFAAQVAQLNSNVMSFFPKSNIKRGRK